MSRRFPLRAGRTSLGMRLAAVLLATGLPACAGAPPPPSPEPGTPEANVLVSVQNQNLNDVNVFLNLNGVTRRLGTVTSQATSSFEIPWGQLAAGGQIALIISPIGAAGAYRTGSLALRPGSQVTVNVTPILRNSSTQVY